MVQAQFAAEPEGLDEDEDQHLQMADIDVDLGEAGRNWERAPLPPIDPRADAISACYMVERHLLVTCRCSICTLPISLRS